MSEKDIIAAGDRERTYGFFAGLCLQPPSDAVIDMIRDGSIVSVFHGGAGAGADRHLLEFILQADGIKNLRDEMDAEHAALFALPSGVLPHEAIYADKEKRLGGRVTMSVSSFYECAGATVIEESKEVPDHLGMELEFMGFLCNLEKQLWEGSDRPMLVKCIELQKTFLEEHLSKWAYRCCDEITRRAAYGFYKAVAHSIKEFLKYEEEYIKELYARVRREDETICEAST